MALSIAQKLRIKEGMRLLTRNAPNNFSALLQPLPDGVKISASFRNFDQLHWFVKDKKQMEAELPAILPLVSPGVLCWIYYPKGSSGMQTDLTRDKGWDALLKLPSYQWVNLVSFNDTWSAFGMRHQEGSSLQRSTAGREKPQNPYIDPVARTVKAPEDLEMAFKKRKDAAAWFESLAYSHRKEYVEWITSAKKEETRNKRVQATIDMLLQKKKNPADR